MWVYRAALLRVIDGDTLELLIDLGFSVRTEQHIRLLDVSAPERTQPGGPEATAWVAQWLTQLLTHPALAGRQWPLVVQTVPNRNPEPEEQRTFTRYLGTIWAAHDAGTSLNTALAAWLAQHPEWRP